MKPSTFKDYKAKTRSGKWVSGNLVYQGIGSVINQGRAFIADHASSFRYDPEADNFQLGGFVEVDPRTICQSTGIVDVRGEMIYEHDIVTIVSSKKQGLPAIVRWRKRLAAFVLERNGYNYILFDEDGETKYERLGNYYD